MCLTSKWAFPKKTDHDITCYKVLEVHFTSEGKKYITPFTGFDVDITKPLVAEGNSFTLNKSKNKIKTKGYIHTFSLLSDAKYYCNDYIMRRVVFQCIIPKNTKYHESNSIYGGEYCSKEIIFTKQVY